MIPAHLFSHLLPVHLDGTKSHEERLSFWSNSCCTLNLILIVALTAFQDETTHYKRMIKVNSAYHKVMRATRRERQRFS